MPTSTSRGGARPGRTSVRDLAGHGDVALNRVELDGTPLIAEISRFADLAGPRRVGSIRTDFVYKSRRITTDHFTLNIGRMPITMSGWTDLDGRIDYQMKISGLNERLPDRARRILGELKLDVGSLTALTLRGTLDKMVVQVNGVPIDRQPGPRAAPPPRRPGTPPPPRPPASRPAPALNGDPRERRAPGVARLDVPHPAELASVEPSWSGRPHIPPRLIPGRGRL